MRKVVLILFLFISDNLLSQQLPEFTQNMYNIQYLNPAVTGSEKHIVTQFTHRSQWVGFGNSPKTQLLSIHSSIDKKNFGLGTYLFNDSYGPVNTFGINISYAYHIEVYEKTNLSFGLSATGFQLSMDVNKINLNNNIDPLIDLNTASNTYAYNGAFGVMLKNYNYYLAGSILNLIPQKTRVLVNGIQPTVFHYNIIGGVKINMNDHSYLYPSSLLKIIQNNPAQIDFNIRYNYSELFELGVSYRTDDALALLLNIGVLEYLNMIYSYDFTISNLNNASNGSHEVTLRYIIFYNPIYKKMHKRYNLKFVNEDKKD